MGGKNKIFISYRREDSPHATGRIYHELIKHFNKEDIFKDVDSIPLGTDFHTYIDEQVGKCQILLAVIGEKWVDSKNEEGTLRLEDPEDFVRIEIESALKRKIPVIPLLVDRNKVPMASQLPGSLRALTRRHGTAIRPDPDFDRDINYLIKSLKELLVQSEEKEQKGLEDKLEAEKQEEQREEDLWAKACKGHTITSYQAYLKATALGTHRRNATMRVKELAWQADAKQAPKASSEEEKIATESKNSRQSPETEDPALSRTIDHIKNRLSLRGYLYLALGVIIVLLIPVWIHWMSDDPNSQYLQGQEKYEAGEYPEAFKLFMKAAQDGHIDAMNDVGIMYESGYGVDENFDKALEWYMKGAEAGNADAMNNLGLIYQTGDKVELDNKKAVAWFTQAATAGLVDAMNTLGLIYENGREVKKDKKKALDWYTKAANVGHAKAMNRVGDFYYLGQGTEKDYNKALQWYMQSAKAGNTAAMYNVGYLYRNGLGIEKDLDKAFEWNNKAARAGYTKALNGTGYHYQHGLGVEQDYHKAMEWYARAAKVGNIAAMNNIGILHGQGLGVEKDNSKALEWYTKAADAGYAPAIYNVGFYYEKGYEVEKDVQKAREYYQKAAGLGNENAKKALKRLGEG